ncbi:MAG: hypothetical protein CMI60_18115 [Parvibaculum sp.]|nr:hypothetical protein [Parvibaculum sp.]
MEDETHTPPEPRFFSPSQYKSIFTRHRDRIQQYLTLADQLIKYTDEQTDSGGRSQLMFQPTLYQAIDQLVDGMADAATDLQYETAKQVKAIDFHGCQTDDMLQELWKKEQR